MPGGEGLGRCQVGVARGRGEWQARGALPRAAVAGEGGSSRGGGFGQTPPPRTLGRPEGVACVIFLGISQFLMKEVGSVASYRTLWSLVQRRAFFVEQLFKL